jgi:DNA-binding XRE family transcriptional regulator
MKKTIVTLACCALIAALAFAQTRSTSKTETATNAETVTVTGQTITAIEEGAATSYQPAKTLVIREDNSNKPGNYVLNGPGHVVDKAGAPVKTAVKPNTRVRVYFTNNGEERVIDHIVVLD